jgi:hypothetical protein
MSRGKASGYTLDRQDVAVVLGMQARGDRDHDIAAWFGVNQGRVAEAKERRYGSVQPTPADELPPKGAPGVKGRRLRDAVDAALEVLDQEGPGGLSAAVALLRRAQARYDRNEV